MHIYNYLGHAAEIALPEGAELDTEHDGFVIRHRFHFANGYGASVISGVGTYGGEKGLWELGVIGPDGRLAYNTPVTSDVAGHLSDKELQELIDQTAAL